MQAAKIKFQQSQPRHAKGFEAHWPRFTFASAVCCAADLLVCAAWIFFAPSAPSNLTLSVRDEFERAGASMLTIHIKRIYQRGDPLSA